MVLEKFSEAYRQEYLDMSTEFFQSGATISTIDTQNFVRTFEQILSQSPLCDGYIIKVDEQIVGYTHLAFSWNNDLGGKVLWVEEIFIKPEFQGLGFGSLVMKQIEQLYQGSIAAIRLEVSEENINATRLYEKLGFENRAYIQYCKETACY